MEVLWSKLVVMDSREAYVPYPYSFADNYIYNLYVCSRRGKDRPLVGQCFKRIITILMYAIVQFNDHRGRHRHA